ncbi:SIMPL domain-containing protein [Modicisalibacter coralii]|uniref:SIMPL domain-containing protein n=1 Tax=Modicisalibacter coralii TaxID=2304602 RepID=UPI00100AF9B0|nr:SIMPL domain-containing protein [Halomonas coralii]
MLSAIPRRSLSRAMIFTGLMGASLLAQAQPDTPPNRLSVQAQATLAVAPDIATLNARLWERTPAVAESDARHADPEALAKARERLESRTAELIRTLEKQGIDDGAINAGSLVVRPDSVQRRDGDGPGETLVRTQLERPISLRIDDLSRLPAILDALTRAGVDALDGVSYDLADRDAATDQALEDALEKARHKAQLMARTLGVELGEVLQVDETGVPRYTPQMMSLRADGAERKTTAEYRPGEIELDAGVSVVWSIESAETP